MGNEEELAGTVLYLASKAGGYCNGEIIPLEADSKKWCVLIILIRRQCYGHRRRLSGKSPGIVLNAAMQALGRMAVYVGDSIVERQ
jgi:hypothetical protein